MMQKEVATSIFIVKSLAVENRVNIVEKPVEKLIPL